MKKGMLALSLLVLSGAAEGQVLGKAISLQQTGICPVLGCDQLKEVQVSSSVKYIEGRNKNYDDNKTAGGGVAAFYVNGKLAALGWQEVGNYDTPNIGATTLNQLSKISIGVAAPKQVLAYVRPNYGLQFEGKTLAAQNAFIRPLMYGRRGILFIHKDYLQVINKAIGRDDTKTAQWLLQNFFKKYGLKAIKTGEYKYRIFGSRSVLDKSEQYFEQSKKLENTACCGHPGKSYAFPGLSGTFVDFMPDYGDGVDYSRPVKAIDVTIETLR